MQLVAQDVLIQRFVPDDGTASTAIRVVHRTERTEATNGDTVSPRQNLRTAVAELVGRLNPHPDHIGKPELLLFDEVTVKLPESTHDGHITEMSWNFTTSEWRYFVKCSNVNATAWYVIADLQLFVEVG